jgi:hypothetical protein
MVDIEKFGFMMWAHFPSVHPGQVQDLRCEVCQDLKDKHCPGQNLKGEDVIHCMMEKAEFSEFHIIRSSLAMH